MKKRAKKMVCKLDIDQEIYSKHKKFRNDEMSNGFIVTPKNDLLRLKISNINEKTAFLTFLGK